MEACNFGMLGLGVMGQNFTLNLERNGCVVAVYERIEGVAKKFVEEKAMGKNIHASSQIEEFVQMLSRPRHIMLLIKAGEPIDTTIALLLPHLKRGDLIIDGGNSHFKDTERREKKLAEVGIQYIGMGVSGGEEGALKGPSLMPGGSEQAYHDIEPTLLKVAAKTENETPCVGYIGPGGAGHYVKMVHNGIEYALMQILAEAYDLLKRVCGFSANDFVKLFTKWNNGNLQSFLVEASIEVFKKIDESSGKPLIDMILDTAEQKGTGAWTVEEGANIGSAIPTIGAALNARIISSLKQERVNASKILKGSSVRYSDEQKKHIVKTVRDAVYASNICSYAQGLNLIRKASDEYHYSIDVKNVAKIWRGGCIIRAKLLEDIVGAFEKDQELSNVLLDKQIQLYIAQSQSGWRSMVKTAIDMGIPIPSISASLAYYDSYRSEFLPANLIQAQRDLFGAHTFERIDKTGIFHAEWMSSAAK